MARKLTNEQEFQGQVLSWLNQEIARNPSMALDKVTQEPSKISRKRNDLVVWANREAEQVFLTGELKTPETLLSDPELLDDACEKARRWGAPYFFIWNMEGAELYQTPNGSRPANVNDRVEIYLPDPLVTTVDDWLKPQPQKSLKRRALKLLHDSWDHQVRKGTPSIHIDASIFVDKLSQNLRALKPLIAKELSQKAASSKEIRRRIREIAAAQGFLDFVDDLHSAIAGQYAYRIIGQILFYFSLRRKQPALPPLEPPPGKPLRAALLPFWNEVRKFDYEALYKAGEIDDIVPIPAAADKLIRRLITDWAEYDWNELQDDVLGSIFEHLIPTQEQLLLGQFYTPSRVADLVLAFAIDGASPTVLDPGCGSGTFLMRAHSFLSETTSLSHAEVLRLLWGFDISAFACELAVINLFRQNFAEFDNFPRIVAGDFFDRRVNEPLEFPPARRGGQAKVTVPIPLFRTVVGNPPYLRSQNQDDLDPAYRTRLFQAAGRVKIAALPKTDLFAFFAYQALQFLEPGGRLGFVTSSSWLTAEFGAQLQRILLDQCEIIAIVTSSQESFFSQVDINTVLVIAKKREVPGVAEGEVIRFVSLNKPLHELWTDGEPYWESVRDLADEIERQLESMDTDAFRIKVVPAGPEFSALSNQPDQVRNWSMYLRAPLSFFELFA